MPSEAKSAINGITSSLLSALQRSFDAMAVAEDKDPLQIELSQHSASCKEHVSRLAERDAIVQTVRFLGFVAPVPNSVS